MCITHFRLFAMIKKFIAVLVVAVLCSCRSVDIITLRPPDDDNFNPTHAAMKLQGVYVWTSAEDSSNPSVLVLSPTLNIPEKNAYMLRVDAVLVKRGAFFDKGDVKQWTDLPVGNKTIYYTNGTVFGKFLDDDYTKLWVRGHSTDSDNEREWESYYKKVE